MNDFFEIDFLDVKAAKSGDAIPLWYRVAGATYVHVVDGGFKDTGPEIVQHIREYYDNPSFIDHVVLTHPDGDHARGLQPVLEEFDVGVLWMLRPWDYAAEIIDRFTNYTSVPNLIRRFKELYPNVARLEEIALTKRIPILEPFQGAGIGAFRVLAPTRSRYLDLLVESEKTPESVREAMRTAIGGVFRRALEAAAALVKAPWGVENLPPKDTSAENEMSVVQFARLCDHSILLTGDAGRNALTEAAAYAPYAGLSLPGVDRCQIPHHGSRRNVHTELLDHWFGPRLTAMPETGTWTAVVSATKDDKDHPRKAVVRGFRHRGASVHSTENGGFYSFSGTALRPGWHQAVPLEYPEEQESD